ncbi:unnamed protein product [Mytilus edulis]|uniref:Reverse transcriptase domain-containing protein n=1 Tax=Mytilus edulis TaxID=6550 RepID=A0A8S3QGT8_MYTED|nr:unnamed protein product [Mytilus edulis]
MDLNVNGHCYTGDENILAGFKEHFRTLATYDENINIDNDYHQNVEHEIHIINQLVKGKNIPDASSEEISNAIKNINKGKSADYYGITIEHIVNAGEIMVILLQSIINEIFQQGYVPDLLKIGLLTPIFKNKGSKNDAGNYRGITVLPVVSKIIDTVLKNRTQPSVKAVQHKYQRGFTSGSGPMNSALPVEEVYREVHDGETEAQIILLDAKSAFDKVIHTHMMRRVYQAGIEDKHWSLISSLHQNAASTIKWGGNISECFPVSLGVRQGGILSTDLYKLYVNPLLDRLENSNLGIRIGNITCNASACADDIALMSTKEDDTQVLINMAHDFAYMEGYELQPKKSVALNLLSKTHKKNNTNECIFNIGNNVMPNVKQALHLGIIRTTSMKENVAINVEENIKKARRSAYGLFGGGFHGHNGLDPETLVHLFKTYISPVLLYGMELLLPKTAMLLQLEKFQKRLLKQLLSLPTSTPDPAVYILSGILPVEAQIDKRALGLFNNICNQDESSTEKQLARRQISVKSLDSNSWFIQLKKILTKYNMDEINTYLDIPMKKEKWITLINRIIQKHWSDSITRMVPYYKGLQHLNYTEFHQGKLHPLLKIKCQSARDIGRIPPKLKMLTGTYILQSHRIKMYENETDPICLICHQGDETLEHFILECEGLSDTRNSIMDEISAILKDSRNVDFHKQSSKVKMQILLDITMLRENLKLDAQLMAEIEYCSRRLLFLLHTTRYSFLSKGWKKDKKNVKV